MKRIKLTISYDGTNYQGWQIQKTGLGIEQVINEHLSRLLKEDVKILGASRTDSGVHALGNVAVFDTNTRIPPEKIYLALNQRLPSDIKIVKSEEAPEDFHPRYMAKAKTYEYRILNCRVDMPLLRLYHDYVYYPLDTEKMKEAAGCLVGEHDFKAFSTAGGQQKTTIRTIYFLDIKESPLYASDQENAAAFAASGRDYVPKIITITIKGNGFLYNMVRLIAGALEKAGMGVFPASHVKEILESKDRRLSPAKASARGLTLVRIDY